MTEKEHLYGTYFAKVDSMEVLIRVQEAKEFLKRGEVDDAFAYAIAAGIKMGIMAVLNNTDVK